MDKTAAKASSKTKTVQVAEQTDDLAFGLTPRHSVELQAVKRRRLSDLFGALPATRPFPGKEATREEVGKALGQRHASAPSM